MADIEAAKNWAFESVWTHMQTRVASEIDTFDSLAGWMFDEDISARGAIGDRLYMTSPNDDAPCVYFEKGRQLEIVFEWESEEVFRDNVHAGFYDEIMMYFET